MLTTGNLKTQSTPNKANPVIARNPSRTYDKSDATFARNVADIANTPDFSQQAPQQIPNPAHTYSVERPQQPVSRIVKRSKDGLLPRRQLIQTKNQ